MGPRMAGPGSKFRIPSMVSTECIPLWPHGKAEKSWTVHRGMCPSVVYLPTYLPQTSSQSRSTLLVLPHLAGRGDVQAVAAFFNFTGTCLKPLLPNICIQKLKITPVGTHIVFNFLRSLRQWLELGTGVGVGNCF